jgi:membrane dipeptidase
MHPIFDAHLDLAYNALGYDRDQTDELAAIRRREAALTGPDGESAARNGWSTATVTLPEMRRANVAVCLATLLARTKPMIVRETCPPRYDMDSAARAITFAMAQGQLAYYRALEAVGEVVLIRDSGSLQRHWRRYTSGETRAIGIILSMEGCDPILEPSQARAWWDQGLRTACLAHYAQGIYGYGTGGDGPLTPEGRELLGEFARLGVILDLVHTAETAFYEAAERFAGPVFVSHANCRAIVPGDRQLSDEQIKLVASRSGVIGVALDAWMLLRDYRRRVTPRSCVGMDAVADHIDHLCQVTGNCDHVAIGSDLDGGFGAEQCPHDLQSIADLQKIGAVLAQRGYGDHEIAAVLYGNWLRYFTAALPEA